MTLDQIPPTLQNATVAIEDSRFYQNNGIDFRGIGRAISKDTNGNDHTAQGGSTITQQLVQTWASAAWTAGKRFSAKPAKSCSR